jgi:hypothetical protein
MPHCVSDSEESEDEEDAEVLCNQVSFQGEVDTLRRSDVSAIGGSYITWQVFNAVVA